MNKKESSSKTVIKASAVYNWSDGFITMEGPCIVKPNDYNTETGSKRMYIKFDLPAFPKQETVKSAVLQLWEDEGENGGATKIGVYQALRAPRKGRFVPFPAQYPLDYSEPIRTQTAAMHVFDVTELLQLKKPLRKLYLEVRATDETESDGSYARFISQSDSNYSPQIIVKTALQKQEKREFLPIPDSSVNFLNGHGFDSFLDLSKWNEEFNCDDFEIAPRRAGALFGNAAALFRSYDDTAQDSGISQSVRLYTAGTYVFSAYFRIIGDSIQSQVHSVVPGIYLRIRSNDRILAQSQPITEAKQYVRVCIPFTARTCEIVKAEIKMNGNGSVLVDGAQLEYKTLRPYNLLKNAEFTDGLSEWQHSPFMVQPSTVELPSESYKRSVRLLSAPGHRTYICQHILLGAPMGEPPLYSFSAVACAKGAIPNTFHKNTQPIFQIGAKIIYADAFTEDHYAEFSPNREGFSYAEITFSPNPNRFAERIDVFCEYSNNFGYADFGNLCLINKNETKN